MTVLVYSSILVCDVYRNTRGLKLLLIESLFEPLIVSARLAMVYMLVNRYATDD